MSKTREDWGFFGPDSVTWRVWTSPTALLAFKRSIVVESFDPFLAISVHESNGVRTDPQRRFDRTLQYFLTVACSDSRTAVEASEMLMRVHAKSTGTEPISGKPYSANAPESQLWIHVTGWHSNLICYERFGPGKLSAEDERRYWAECVTAAELQTCKPADVPRSREEVREYYAQVRSRLCMSEYARDLVHYFLAPPKTVTGIARRTIARISSRAVVSTIPRWMRELGGFDQSAAMDAAVGPVMRTLVRAASAPERRIAILRDMAPSAALVLEGALRGERPLRDEVTTPAEARARARARSDAGPRAVTAQLASAAP